MLPEPLARERDRVECMSFMGLLPEIDHAWMTVDNVLFLWNYHTQNFTQFRDLEQVCSGRRMVEACVCGCPCPTRWKMVEAGVYPGGFHRMHYSVLRAWVFFLCVYSELGVGAYPSF